MEGYKRRTDEKKTKILNAAKQLFREKGFAETTIKDIATLSGVSHVSIYNYFGDKKNMTKTILLEYIEQSFAKCDELIESNCSFKEKLSAITKMKTDGINDTHDLFLQSTMQDEFLKIMFNEVLLEKSNNYKIRLFDMGKAEGYIDNSIPTDLIIEFTDYATKYFVENGLLNKPIEYQIGLYKLMMNGIIGKMEGL